MMRPQPSISLALAALSFCAGNARAQSLPAIELVVEAGTPLRVELHDRVKMKQPGQPLTGSLIEPVYAYDRIVLPAGTRVLGHVASFESVGGRERTGAILGGDLTPLRRAIVTFDTLVLADGSEIAVSTEVRAAAERLVLSTRETPKKNPAEQAVDAAAVKARETVRSVKQPRKLNRLAHGLVMALPYHPQYLNAGTVYTAVLLAPLRFGTAEATEPAAAGERPAPDSVLHARLLTALDSRTTKRGTPVRAMVTRPVFSEDGKLLLPEGSVLSGEVTLAKAARRFHRSGQLRFLFESVQAPQRAAETLRASLYSVQASRDARIALDDEGGASSPDSATRFVVPAIASLALVGALQGHVDYDTDGLGPETQYGSTLTHSLSGFFGWGVAGLLLAQVSHPLAVAFGIIGVARTVYASVFGKGRDVVFSEGTAMELQLAAQPERAP